ncbi:unnamed protein product [Cladocopium goreaui]|uniref:Tubulin epsilon and delta complex protein 1 domain-containing protein n=1 Tax=Cladocopium goreaui TaxID=2562237 RepID=A0A9P1DKM2_9DINO|nr:unnamed protein product [Cladocopium goreaui]
MADAAETRAALEFVCETLRKKLPDIDMDAECMRRAKHDDPTVMPRMWALIIQLLELQRDMPTNSKGLHEQPETNQSLQLPAFIPKYAAIYSLSALGYPRADKLAVQSSENNLNQAQNAQAHPSESGSRELLLALGFLLDTMDLLSAHGKLAPYPPDISCVPDRSDRSQKEEKATSNCHQSIGCEAAREKNTSIHVLQIYTKWQNEMRRLQHLDAHRLDVLQKLHTRACQSVERAMAMTNPTNPIKPKTPPAPPTQYELFVLERPALLSEHIQELEADIESRSSHVKKEELFWRWMGSVLKAANSETFEKVETAPSGKSEAVSKSATTSRSVFSSDKVLDSLDKCRDSWQVLEVKKGQPLEVTARGDLRERFDLHKMLPQEVQQRLKAELRKLGASFDEILPSPWLLQSGQIPEFAEFAEFGPGLEKDGSASEASAACPKRHMIQATSIGEGRQRHEPRGQGNTLNAVAAVADLRERYAKTAERHTTFRSFASQKLETTLALAASDVFVKGCAGWGMCFFGLFGHEKFLHLNTSVCGHLAAKLQDGGKS